MSDCKMFMILYDQLKHDGPETANEIILHVQPSVP